MMENIKSDKQILVDWYFSMIAAQLGQDCELFVSTGEVFEGEIGGPMVEKKLAYSTKV